MTNSRIKYDKDTIRITMKGWRHSSVDTSTCLICIQTWVPSSALHKPGVVVAHACNFNTQKEEEQKFKVT